MVQKIQNTGKLGDAANSEGMVKTLDQSIAGQNVHHTARINAFIFVLAMAVDFIHK